MTLASPRRRREVIDALRRGIARATGGSVRPEPTDAAVVAHVVRGPALVWGGPTLEHRLD